MNLNYKDNVEQAARFAKSALTHAQQFNLPIDPVTYSVLYEHISGKNNKLSDALKQLGIEHRLSSSEIRSLFINFIASNSEEDKVFEELKISLGNIVNETLTSLDNVNLESGNYQEYLLKASEELETTASASAITDIIDETEKMRAKSHALQSELTSAQQELKELKESFNRVQEESLCDPLTGIKNRRSFESSILHLCNVSQRDNSDLCVLMVDLDHFKQINDTHGHPAGDAVLKWVSHLMKSVVRGCDIVSRYGGEEFALLLPETNIEGAGYLGEKILKKMTAQTLRISNKLIGTVTASIGIAEYDKIESAENLISRADRALYKAKDSGRNCVMPAE